MKTNTLFEGTSVKTGPSYILRMTALTLLFLFTIKSNAQTVEWAYQCEGITGSNRPSALATNASGEVFVVGVYSGTTSFGTYTLGGGSHLPYLTKTDPGGTVLWAKSFGNTATSLEKIAIDGQDNILLQGTVLSTVTIGNFTLDPAIGGINFVAKLDATGIVLWAKQLGAPSSTLNIFDIWKIAADGQGNLYIAGRFKGTLNLGSSTLSSSDYDMLVAKLDPSGSIVWAKQYGSPTDWDDGNGIAVDGAGNVLVAGGFRGIGTFAPHLITSTGDYNGVIFKLDPATGDAIWVTQFGGAGVDVAHHLTCDKAGNAYFSGTYTPPIVVGTTTYTSGEILLGKLDPSGNILWTQKFDGLGIQLKGITSDGAGNIYSTGGLSGTGYFGSTSLSAAALTSDGADAFISKLGNGGNFAWVQKFGGQGEQMAYDIVTDQKGRLFVTGDIRYEGIIGTHTLTAPDPNIPGSFLLKISADPTVYIKENGSISGALQVYPNPANTSFFIESKTSWKHLNVKLTDISGKELLDMTSIDKSIEELDISKLAPGVYFLQLISENEMQVRKLIRE